MTHHLHNTLPERDLAPVSGIDKLSSLPRCLIQLHAVRQIFYPITAYLVERIQYQTNALAYVSLFAGLRGAGERSRAVSDA